jgi:hypothetical protein
LPGQGSVGGAPSVRRRDQPQAGLS